MYYRNNECSNPAEIVDYKHLMVLNRVFKERKAISDSTVEQRIKEEFLLKKVFIRRTRTGLFLNYYLEKGWVVKPYTGIKRCLCIFYK
jgi:hypothetical protein